MLYRGPDGKEIPTGKVKTEFVENFLEAHLRSPENPWKFPYWLECDSGKPTFFSPLTGYGGIQVDNDSVQATYARLRTIEVNSRFFTEISITVESFQLNGQVNTNAQIAIKGTDCGIALFQNVNQTVATLRVYRPGQNANVDYPTKIALFGFGSEAEQPKNITLRLLLDNMYPVSIEKYGIKRPVMVYVQADDAIGFEQNIADSFLHGNLRGVIQTNANAAVLKYFKLLQTKFTLVRN